MNPVTIRPDEKSKQKLAVVLARMYVGVGTINKWLTVMLADEQDEKHKSPTTIVNEDDFVSGVLALFPDKLRIVPPAAKPITLHVVVGSAQLIKENGMDALSSYDFLSDGEASAFKQGVEVGSGYEDASVFDSQEEAKELVRKIVDD